MIGYLLQAGPTAEKCYEHKRLREKIADRIQLKTDDLTAVATNHVLFL